MVQDDSEGRMWKEMTINYFKQLCQIVWNCWWSQKEVCISRLLSENRTRDLSQTKG